MNTAFDKARFMHALMAIGLFLYGAMLVGAFLTDRELFWALLIVPVGTVLAITAILLPCIWYASRKQ
jgi:quinol-cytochrome oxidoreductase complex cytochrome b subunit